MKQILLIGGMEASNDTERMLRFCDEFQEILSASQVHVSFCHYDEVSFIFSSEEYTVTDHRNNRPLTFYDQVFFKGPIPKTYIAYALSRYLGYAKIPYANDYAAYKPLNKIPQLIDMSELGLRFPITLYSANKDKLLQLTEKILSFPVVVKSIGGSKGQRNALANTVNDVKEMFKKYRSFQFFVQEYIPCNDDFRVLIIGKQLSILHRYSAKGSYLHNMAQGAVVEIVPKDTLPEEVVEQARLLAAKTRLQIAGVDLVYNPTNKSYYFLEINSQPGLYPPDVQKFLMAMLK